MAAGAVEAIHQTWICRGISWQLPKTAALATEAGTGAGTHIYICVYTHIYIYIYGVQGI